MFLPFHLGIGDVLTKIFSKKRFYRSNIAESHGALPQSIPLCLRAMPFSPCRGRVRLLSINCGTRTVGAPHAGESVCGSGAPAAEVGRAGACPWKRSRRRRWRWRIVEYMPGNRAEAK
jgi:hypothetical protein